ncbi:MAG: Rhs element Vgr protein, partial [Sinomicrobium sp.]|nr:Rhs element Vgr protein [Sinomicrobium sp.]
NPKIKVGQTIEIKGVGKHFTGKNIISGVRHEATLNGWVTHIQIGMDACWFTARQNVVDAQAAGLLPGVNGLQIGVVEAHKENKDNKFLILVRIPAFDPVQDKEGKVWARLASIDAGSERGVFFLPQEGDEVVVGFLNDDPRQAVILGAMHSTTNKVPGSVKLEKKKQKGIFTKSKYQLLFDEENEMIMLSSEKNKICIDEKQKRITLEDANKNQVELSEKGVMIISAKDCGINAKGDFTIEAKGNVKIKGKKVDLI